jgi:hypothetical protein
MFTPQSLATSRFEIYLHQQYESPKLCNTPTLSRDISVVRSEYEQNSILSSIGPCENGARHGVT